MTTWVLLSAHVRGDEGALVDNVWEVPFSYRTGARVFTCRPLVNAIASEPATLLAG